MSESFKLRAGAAVATLASIVLVAAGCTERAADPPRARPAPAVEVARPVVQEITEWDEYTGRLAAQEFVEVRARVGGFLDSVHFKDGQLVARGDLLFVIDPRPFRAVLAAADADVKRLESHLALAKNEVERGERLAGTNAISAEDLDARLKSRDQAVAALEGARARREQARLDVEFTEVRAPIAGRTARHLVSVGNLVSGGSNQSTLLTTIAALDPIQCYVDIEEQAFLRYARMAISGERQSSRDGKTPVRIAVGDEQDFRFQGIVDFVDNRLDPDTGTLRGRALISNPDRTLLPGLFVRVQVEGSGAHRAVLVPDSAVGTDQSNRFVYTLDAGNAVRQRNVILGRIIDGLRVIRSGLDGSETIVIRGVQRIRPGAIVAPEPTTITARSAASTMPAAASAPAAPSNPSSSTAPAAPTATGGGK